MIEVIERTGSQVFRFSPNSTAISVLFDSSNIEQDFFYQELKKDYHVGIQCFIQDISLTTEIKSLTDTDVPPIRASDTYQQRQAAFNAAKESSQYYSLKLYIADNRSAWIPKGEVILQNLKSPYYRSLLTPYFTAAGEVFAAGRSIDGNYLKIGANITGRFGSIKPQDTVALLTSYTLKYSILPKDKSAAPSIALQFNVEVPILRNAEKPVAVRPANPNRSEVWLESHSDAPIWFGFGPKNGLKPGEQGLALYGVGASYWLQPSSLGSKQAIWALAVPPEEDDLENNFARLSGIEIIQQ